MKIAITGATGFIGKCLVQQHCDAGDEVNILTRRDAKNLDLNENIKVFNGDLSIQSSTLSAFVSGADILYHCAAEIRIESKMEEINVIGTENLIRAAQGNVKHWVQLSSVGVYGPVYDGIVTEKNALNPNNMYERTKLISDEKVLSAAADGKFTLTILRPSNVFGPDMRNASLFALIKAVDKGLFFFIGPEGASANYIAVENVVNALILCGTNNAAKGKIYNVSDWITIEDFIKIIADGLGKPYPKFRFPLLLMKLAGKLGDKISKMPLTSGRVNALSNRSIYSNDLITNDIGYKNMAPVSTAIKSLVKRYQYPVS